MKVRNEEEKQSKETILSLKKKYVKILIVFNLICIYLTYISSFNERFLEVYPNWKPTIDEITFYAFFFGTLHSEKTGIYTFAFQCSGYLLIVGLLILERKAEIWVDNRFGCSQKVIDFYIHVEKKLNETRQKSLDWFSLHFDINTGEIESKHSSPSPRKTKDFSPGINRSPKEESKDKHSDTDSSDFKSDSSYESDEEFDIYNNDAKLITKK